MEPCQWILIYGHFLSWLLSVGGSNVLLSHFFYVHCVNVALSFCELTTEPWKKSSNMYVIHMFFQRHIMLYTSLCMCRKMALSYLIFFTPCPPPIPPGCNLVQMKRKNPIWQVWATQPFNVELKESIWKKKKKESWKRT